VRYVNENRKQPIMVATAWSLLPPSIPIGWRLRLLRENSFLAVFVYATQAIAFEWKPGLSSFLTAHQHIKGHFVPLQVGS